MKRWGALILLGMGFGLFYFFYGTEKGAPVLEVNDPEVTAPSPSYSDTQMSSKQSTIPPQSQVRSTEENADAEVSKQTNQNVSQQEHPENHPTQAAPPPKVLKPLLSHSPSEDIDIRSVDTCNTTDVAAEKELEQYTFVDFKKLAPQLHRILLTPIQLGGTQAYGAMVTGENLLEVLQGVTGVSFTVGGGFNNESNVAIAGCYPLKSVLGIIARGTDSKWGISESSQRLTVYFK